MTRSFEAGVVAWRLLLLAIFVTVGILLGVLFSRVDDLNNRVNSAGDKLAVLECSHVWNDQTRTITHSIYSEYHRCLKTIQR